MTRQRINITIDSDLLKALDYLTFTQKHTEAEFKKITIPDALDKLIAKTRSACIEIGVAMYIKNALDNYEKLKEFPELETEIRKSHAIFVERIKALQET